MTPPFDAILARLQNVKANGKGYTALCPAHDDQRRSLSIARAEDGKILFKCFAGCKPQDIAGALGLPMRDLFPAPAPTAKPQIIATYDYRDESGALLYQTLRYLPKDFRQRRPNGAGDWVWNLNGTRRVLYRLPELLCANPGEPVFVVEGEKDADNLARLGLYATTNAGGANNWRAEYAPALRGRHVVIIPDNDDAGRKHAAIIAQSVKPLAASVKILELPNLPPKSDVSDWLNASGDRDALCELAGRAPSYPAQGMEAQELTALAEMPAPDYPDDDTPYIGRDGTAYDIQANGTMTPASGKTANTAPEMPFEIVRAADLGEYTAPDWLVSDILQIPSLNIFYGESGGGKTWALLELAFRVSRGDTWLQHTTKAAPVLIVDTESGKRRIKNRIRAIERGAGDLFGQDTFVITDRAINLNLATLGQAGKQAQQHKDLLKAAIESCGAKFVIVDAFADIAQGADENAAQGVMPTLTALREISNDTECAIVCVHHSNRNHSSKGGNYRGSSAIKGAVDCMMELQTVPDSTGYVAKLETTKQRDGKPVTLYARAAFKELVDEADPFQVAPAFTVKTASEADFDTSARAILDTLEADEKSISQIEADLSSEGIEITHGNLKKKLARLVKAKALVMDGKNKSARYRRIAER